VTRESGPSGFAVVAASTLVIAVAGLAVRLVVTGNYRTYVKPTMAPFLILTAGFLFVLGAWSLVSQHRLHRAQQAPQGQSGHVPQVAWLLVLPVLIVCFLAPSSLGAFTAKRSPDIPPGPVGKVYFAPLPKGDPVRVPLSAYAERAAYGGESALEGRNFVFVAFVTNAEESGPWWYLTRLRIACCAADAVATKVLAVDAAPQPDNQWVTVTGTYLPVGTDRIPRLRVEKATPIAQPEDPYEF
jgi:uncharacterized repeat protein (TIGR03943 family)